jgi:hypothetical protein
MSVRRDSDSAVAPLIDRAHPRTVFAELVAGALCETHIRPSPMAVAYLIGLLDARVGTDSPDDADRDGDVSLAEALLTARCKLGCDRVTGLRALGDRALFVAGYFGDSLSRNVVDLDYYGDIGRAAYANLAETLGSELQETTWRCLYSELAERFDEFVGVLAAVGDRSRPGRKEDLLRVFERYLRTGSERDRARLLQLGHVAPDRTALRFRH